MPRHYAYFVRGEWYVRYEIKRLVIITINASRLINYIVVMMPHAPWK